LAHRFEYPGARGRRVDTLVRARYVARSPVQARTGVRVKNSPTSRVIAGIVLAFACSATAWADDAVSTPATAPTPASGAVDPGASVVKIFATVRRPDPTRPWTKQAPADITGSGVVIEGERILTNAHVVQYASQVQIQANQAGDKLLASVVAVAPGIDLAELKLDDPSFFAEHRALPRAEVMPQIKDAAFAYGFPTGGNSLSITKGIVSRIEFMVYNSLVAGLRIQIDAAINPGNSGGPVLVNDKMVGLAFATTGNNIGYIIPNEEIALFLEDVKGGHYIGKPAMYDDLQTLENAGLRRYLGLDKSVHGIIVHRPYRTDAGYPLKEWDVITAIGTTPVDDQGMITIGSDLRLNFGYMVQKLAKNGYVPLTIVRARKTMSVQMPVTAHRPFMIWGLEGTYPEYFIYGPLVFSRATLENLAMMGSGISARGGIGAFKMMQSPLFREVGLPPTAEREELVIIASPFFPHPLTAGYDNPAGAIVARVNGTPIRSLRHLVATLRDLKDEFVSFELEPDDQESLVFSRKELVDATDAILTDNGIRSQASTDLLAVWNGHPAK
jgi:S1-C subfamily serine protease